MRRLTAATTTLALSAALWAAPSLAATTLTDEGGNVVGVTSDEAYAYLFRLSEDATMLASNTTPTDFTTGSTDVCAAYGDDDYRVVAVDSYTVCNTGVRTDCEGDTGATTADFTCTGGTLSIGGGGPTCGDGVIETPETCDDSNTTPGDGCSDICAEETGWTCTGEPSSCTEDEPPPTWTLPDVPTSLETGTAAAWAASFVLFFAVAFYPQKR